MEERFEGQSARLGPREADAARGGIPELEIDLVSGARALAAGDAIGLLDPRGRPLGAGVADPERGVVRIWSRTPVRRFDGAFFRAKVDAALARRRALLDDPTTDAFRLLHGDGEGLAGIAADAWGPFLTVEAAGSGPARWADAVAAALAGRRSPRGIVVKHAFGDAAPRTAAGGGGRRRAGAPLERGKVEDRVALGEAPPGELVVRERGVPFLVRLLGSRHAGLFTDMREERRRLAAFVPGRRVLNTFAYTGSFSVAAARAGAAEVVTVDIVAKVLDWAKENFRLAGIDPGRHRFARMDAMEYLGLARKRGWTFDAIVLDPPTFAVARGVRWSLGRDYPALVEKALRVLAPGGRVWAAANMAGLAERDLDRWIAGGAVAAGRRVETVARGSQPVDFPAPAGFPRWSYLKVRVLEG